MSALANLREASGAALRRVAHDRVDLWQVSLDLGRNEAGEALGVLSAGERAHAERLRVGAERWVAARAALRRVIGLCLDLAPGSVAFELGANGKPRLAAHADADLRFSLAHSGAVGLIAVRLGHEVGVDLEEIRDDVDGAAIARELFTPRERGSIPATATDPRRAFFRAWVRREALAKVTGRGVVDPVSDSQATGFTVRDLDAPAGYAAAVASEGSEWSVA